MVCIKHWMRDITLFPLIFIIVICCCITSGSVSDESTLKKQDTISRIAFGSCNKHDADQPAWVHIAKFNPQIFVWLGDAVYADTRVFAGLWVPSTVEEMKEKYEIQKRRSDYALIGNSSTCTVIGVWDDHDYGTNDGDYSFPLKEESKKLYLDFIGEAKNSPRRSRDTIFASYTWGPPGQRVQIILLDVRYKKTDNDMLGEVQWGLLESALNPPKGEEADLVLIGSGIQVLVKEKLLQESWAGIPSSRGRLLSIIRKSGAKGVVFLSGDVHMGEIHKTNKCVGGMKRDIVHPTLFDITSSGLTHSFQTHTRHFPSFFVSFLRAIMFDSTSTEVAPGYIGRNFGTLEIDWSKRNVHFSIHNASSGIPVRELDLNIEELVSKPIEGNEILSGCEIYDKVPLWRTFWPYTPHQSLNRVAPPVLLGIIFVVVWYCTRGSSVKEKNCSKENTKKKEKGKNGKNE